MTSAVSRGAVSLVLAFSICAAGAVTPKKPVAPKANATATAAKPAIPTVPPPPAEPPQFIRDVAGVSEYRLANGLQVLLYPDNSKPAVMVNMTYQVGSRHEGPGEAGMAHLLEHMLFKSSSDFTDIAGEFSRRAIRANGTTTVDRTNYFSSFSASDEALAFTLKLEASRMLRASILQADLDKEIGVVRNELEIQENNPVQLLRQRVMSMAFRFHPYGRPVIGTRSDVERVPATRLRSFYREYYQPDNATLIIGGAIDVASTLALVAREFAALPKPTRSLMPTYTAEPPQDGERALSLRRVGNAPVLMAMYHVPALAHADCAPLAVLGQMLSMSPGGSLYKTLVENKLAGQVAAGGCGGHDPGVFTIVAGPRGNTDLREVERQLLDDAEGRTRVDFKEEDLLRAIRQIEAGQRQLLKSPEATVALLSDAVGSGDWRLGFKLMDATPGVTLDDVNRVARLYLQPANRSMGRYQPVSKAEVATIPEVADRSAGLEGLKVPIDLAAGERLDSSLASLQTRTQRLTLPGGARLALLPKNNRGESVSLVMVLRWGEARALARAWEADMVAPLILEGTGRLNRQQLRDEAIRLRSSVNIVANHQSATVYLQAEKSTLLPMLDLLRDLLREPAFPPESFERVRMQVLGNIQVGSKEPAALREALTRPYYNKQLGLSANDPDYLWSPQERYIQLRPITLEQAQSFYKRYWSANDASIAVVGDLPEGLPAALERLFGDWKNPEAPAYVQHIKPFKPVAPARFDAQASDKANAVAQLRQELRLSSQDEDYALLSLVNVALGGVDTDSLLNRRLRGKEGISYGLNSQLQADHWDDSGHWSIRANFAPENRERLLVAVHEEIRQLLEQGLPSADLERARKSLLQIFEQARGQDIGLAMALLGQLRQGEDWAKQAGIEQRLREATLDQVNAALRRHLRPDAWVISTAGDFAAKPPAPPPAAASAPN